MQKTDDNAPVTNKTLVDALDHVITVIKEDFREELSGAESKLRKEMREGFDRSEARETELSRKIDDLRQDLGVVERKVFVRS